MSADQPATERLFSYGTLQEADVQLKIFGRQVTGRPDTLTGYRVIMSPTVDDAFAAKTGARDHRNLMSTAVDSDVVAGTVLAVTSSELALADSYEPTDYRRVRVILRSTTIAWAYVKLS